MPEQRTFAIQTLIVTLVLNAILLGVIYYALGAQQSTSAPILFGVGLVLTLILWAANWFIGRRLLEEAAASAVAEARASVEERKPAAPPITEPAHSTPPPAAPEKPTPPAETAAVQMLSILQREGRLIDFLQEDLSAYEDAQIGAAVRNIHEGSKKALLDHVTLEPIFRENEGSQITVEPGFDVQAVRLSGNVAGDPPFTGTVRHRGWRVIEVDLPQHAHNPEGEMILAAAEIEVNG